MRFSSPPLATRRPFCVLGSALSALPPAGVAPAALRRPPWPPAALLVALRAGLGAGVAGRPRAASAAALGRPRVGGGGAVRLSSSSFLAGGGRRPGVSVVLRAWRGSGRRVRWWRWRRRRLLRRDPTVVLGDGLSPLLLLESRCSFSCWFRGTGCLGGHEVPRRLVVEGLAGDVPGSCTFVPTASSSTSSPTSPLCSFQSQGENPFSSVPYLVWLLVWLQLYCRGGEGWRRAWPLGRRHGHVSGQRWLQEVWPPVARVRPASPGDGGQGVPPRRARRRLLGACGPREFSLKFCGTGLAVSVAASKTCITA